MFKRTAIALGVLSSLALATPAANAALFHFDGNIAYHNDVVFINFSLAAPATSVRVWTDSFDSETNFDPITALWTSSGTRLGENDDDPTVDPATQTWFDSGFTLSNLAAGSYIFSVAAFPNFAVGTNLSQGFQLDGATPESLSTWCQPFSHCGMGTYWSVWLDGVDSANPDNRVPEPGALAMVGLGLAALAGIRRRWA